MDVIQTGLFGEDFEACKPKDDKTNAERQARLVAKRADIGELPAVADPDRRERALADIVEFGITYCFGYHGALLKRKPSKKLKKYARELAECIKVGGLLHVRLFRGAGKTTWIKIAIVWGIVTGHIKFPVVFGATAKLASAIIDDIWSVLEFSESFVTDFPEVAFPIKALEGMAQRCAIQSYHGKRTQIKRTATEIHLPVIDGSIASGAVIVALGAGGACRGLSRRGMRPDFCLLDDVQTQKDAKSKVKTDSLENWQTQDVMGLGGEKQISMAKTSTPIAVNDDSERFASSELHPEFRTINYPFVTKWPSNTDLWLEYDEIWRSSIDAGDPSAKEATDFYREHREAMDEGADIADPGNYDERTELSAVQHARNLLLRMKEKAFNAEYQLITQQPNQLVALREEDIRKQVNGVTRGYMPRETLAVCVYIDVMDSQGLHWVATAFGRDQIAAVIDYGIYPLPHHPATDRGLQEALAKSLSMLIQAQIQTHYPRVGHQGTNTFAVWVDHGWQTKTVVRVCEMYRSRGFANVLSCKGWSSQFFGDGSGKNVVLKGYQVGLRERDGVRFIGQNSDHWKENTQRALRGVPLTPGSISLFGNNPSAHIEFVSHLCAEVLGDKALSMKGVEIFRWFLKPGAVNHFLDCLSGTMAMAGWYRFWSNDEIIDASAGSAIVQRPSKPMKPQRTGGRIIIGGKKKARMQR